MRTYKVKDKRRFNQWLFYLYIFAVLVPFSVMSHRYYSHEVDPIVSIFPATTSILLVLHALIAFFMLMQYIANKDKLYLAVLSFAYSFSALYFVYKLLYYPDVFRAGPVIEGTVNDLAIYWVFRSISMAVVFILTAILYQRRKTLRFNHRKVLGLMLMISLGVLIFAWYLSSKSELIGLKIVSDDGREYSRLWSGNVGYIIGGIWALATALVVSITRLKNLFWLAIGLSCISYLGSVSILHSSIYVHSLVWYYARFFEVLSTFFVVVVLLYDIFMMYKKTLIKYQAYYESSIRDPLTNLYNRRYYYDAMKSCFGKKSSDNFSLAVLVADIDFFKRFNDTYGHIQGDEVIKYVAHTLCRSIRDEDIPSRIGGEEYSALIVDASREEVCALAERFRINVMRDDISDFTGKIPAPVTISVGVYFVSPGDSTVESCIEKADAAMYQAKQSGRNRVVVYGEQAS